MDSTEITLRQYIDMRVEALAREVDVRMKASEIAIDKADDALQYRLEGMNEFRATIEDRANTFATRRETEDLRESVDAQLRSLSKQLYVVVGAMGVLQVIILFLLNR